MSLKAPVAIAVLQKPIPKLLQPKSPHSGAPRQEGVNRTVTINPYIAL